jgi:hypothetical protein
MTALAIVLGLFGLLGWRLAYVWWAEVKRLEIEAEQTKTQVAELVMERLTETEQHTNELTCARSIILRHAMSGRIDTPRA